MVASGSLEYGPFLTCVSPRPYVCGDQAPVDAAEAPSGIDLDASGDRRALGITRRIPVVEKLAAIQWKFAEQDRRSLEEMRRRIIEAAEGYLEHEFLP